MNNNPSKNLETRLKDLEETEARIEKEEKEILAVDQHILEEIESTKKQSQFSRTIYKFRFIISILLTIGVALIWQAVGQISQQVPVLSTAVGALVVGLLILILIDRLTRVKK